ncbi:MAG: hypothetical protein IJN34_02775 [Clostridia bacterium]|nr:hypothetical protein [Clostridia bacterium]
MMFGRKIKITAWAIVLAVVVTLLSGCAEKYSQEYLDEVVELITVEADYYEYPSVVEIYSAPLENCVVVSIYEGYSQKEQLKKDLKKRYGKVLKIQYVDSLPEQF